jgi:hypothetical protein
MSFSQSLSYLQSLCSNLSRADTSSPHTPGNQTPLSMGASASPFPLSAEPSRCSSPAVLISDVPQAMTGLTKPLVRKTIDEANSADAQSIDQRIALRFKDIFKKTNRSEEVDNLVQLGWSLQTLHVLNLRGEKKVKHFYVHNAPLEKSAQASTNPSIRLSKDGSLKAYVKCSQKDDSEKSQIAFDENKLELFARAASIQAAPKIYLCPNLEPQLQQEVAQKKYQNTFITKYVDGGDLINFLLSRETEVATRIDISRKLIKQVQMLHENGIFHRDIKLDNVLIDQFASEVKICDYGFATDSLFANDIPGSIDYIPPEYNQNLFVGQHHTFQNTLAETVKSSYDTSKQDLFTLGLTLFGILTLSSYNDVLKSYIKRNREKLKLTYSKCKTLEEFIDFKQQLSDLIIDRSLDKFPQNIKDLVKGLVQYNPERRMELRMALDLLGN